MISQLHCNFNLLCKAQFYWFQYRFPYIYRVFCENSNNLTKNNVKTFHANSMKEINNLVFTINIKDVII